MKRAIFGVLQFILFFVVLAAGSFLPPFHVRHVISTSAVDGMRVIYLDGLILMTGLMLIILAVEAARKRLSAAGPWTAGAYVLAAVLGLALKFGLTTVYR